MLRVSDEDSKGDAFVDKELLGDAQGEVLGVTLGEVLGETLENVDADMLSEPLGLLP